MKKILFITVGLAWGMTLFAQKTDTSKIRIGDTKIVIVKKNKENDEKLKKLEKGLIEFEQILKEKEIKLKKHELLLDSVETELSKKREDELRKQDEILFRHEEKKINELEKEIDALVRGIVDIESQIEKLDDSNNIYDWDFENEWSHEWDNLSPLGKMKKFRGHWAGFELGLNNYVNKDYKTVLEGDDVLFELNPEISWTFSINFMEFNIPFGKGIGLTTGMGTTWNNYHFRNNVNVYENDLGVITSELDNINKYSKNSLNLWYVNVPLLFEFQIPVAKKRPGVHIAAGIVGSLKLSSKRKAEYSDNINEYEIKNKADFQIPALKYGLTFRIGYKFISLFANYDMQPLFKSGRGPEVYPVSVGLVLISF